MEGEEEGEEEDEETNKNLSTVDKCTMMFRNEFEVYINPMHSDPVGPYGTIYRNVYRIVISIKCPCRQQKR